MRHINLAIQVELYPLPSVWLPQHVHHFLHVFQMESEKSQINTNAIYQPNLIIKYLNHSATTF